MPPAAGYPNLNFQPPPTMPMFGGQQQAGAFGSGASVPMKRFGAPAANPNQPFGRGGAQSLLGDANRAGLFNPYGPPESFFEPIRAEHTAGSQARQRKALLAAKLFGRGDPSQMGFASLQSTLGESGNLARILGGARADQSQQQLKFFQDLMRDFSGVANRGGFRGGGMQP